MRIRLSIKNTNLIKESEAQKIRDRVYEICDKYGVCSSNIGFVEISKQLKTTAGAFHWKFDRINNRKFERKIKLAYNYYQEFGFDHVMKTLNHEMAHFIAHELHNERGHGPVFKKICQAVDGHMNSKHATGQYEQCKTSDFIKSSYKWEYACDCGISYKRKRRISAKMMYRYSCKCGKRLADLRLIKLNRIKQDPPLNI